MMQMLRAGGIQVLTDGIRAADEDNPEGYWEWEAIKRIGREPKVIEQARDKAVKVVSLLLPSLPPTHRYKVIFMLRPIEEVVASQQRMIQRRGTKGAQLDPAQLIVGLTRHRDQALKDLASETTEVLLVQYHEILSHPQAVCDRLVDFLGADVLTEPSQMPSVIRADLCRQRK